MTAHARRVLAIDIGTSSIKAGLIDETGHLSSFVHQPLLSDPAALGMWEPRWWEEALVKVFTAISKSEGLRGNKGARGIRICDALVMSGNGPTLVALDRAGQPLGHALLWIDQQEKRRRDEKSFYLPKVRWFARNQPELMARTEQFLSCPEYLCWRLGAEALTIAPKGDFRHAYWDDRAAVDSGARPSQFPPFVEPGELMGKVNSQGSTQFGIAEGIPIYAGGSDFLMSLAGSGALEEGMICDRAGSSEGLNLCSTRAYYSPAIRVLPHIRTGYFNNAAILGTTGLMFEWFRRLTGQTQKPYQDMMAEIFALEDFAGQPFFFPHQGSAEVRDFSRSLFLNLAPQHGSTHLARAVVESIGFSARRSMELFALQGARLKELRISGGQSKNREWNQMKADILGMEVGILAVRDAELTGNAMFGFLGMGTYSTVEEAASAMVKVEEVISPHQGRHEHYSRRYEEYRSIEKRLGCLFEDE